MAKFAHARFFFPVNFCDPLGGRNVWQTLLPRSNHKSDDISESPPIKALEGNGSIAVLAARMDASSMFDGLVPSSVGAVTGIATLISTAALLHKMINPVVEKYGMYLCFYHCIFYFPLSVQLTSCVYFQADKNVLFLLFAGESYDYIGSSRIVYDMKEGIFPVKPDPSVSQPPPIGLNHIGPFIELSQLKKPAPGKPLHIHHFKTSPEVRGSFEQQVGCID